MTINNEKLKEIYNARPDLQALYFPDGTAINPNNPQVANIPTLMSWAIRYGLQEHPELDPRVETLLEYFPIEDIRKMPDDIKTGLAAFGDVQKKNFELGQANAEINAKTWEDAMRTAAQDPELNQKYGEELQTSATSVGRALQMLDQGYSMEQAATARDQALQTERLGETEAAAGRAYSGFRRQAEDRLKADQSDVIKSSRMRLKQNLQSTIQPFEERFGTDKLNAVNPPVIDGEKYDPINNLEGSVDRDKKAEQKSLAAQFYETTQPPI